MLGYYPWVVARTARAPRYGPMPCHPSAPIGSPALHVMTAHDAVTPGLNPHLPAVVVGSPPPPLSFDPRSQSVPTPCGGRKSGTDLALRCKDQGGWGGSAHYPDPTAQSDRKVAGRTPPRLAPGRRQLPARRSVSRRYGEGWREVVRSPAEGFRAAGAARKTGRRSRNLSPCGTLGWLHQARCSTLRCPPPRL